MSATLTKNQKTIADYYGDLIAVEDHIEQALDHQLNLTKDDPVAGAAVRKFHDMVRDQLKTLRDKQSEQGSTAGNPIKSAGSSILGKAAGLIDMVRTEAISKALRDDYTAFSWAAISYSMFHTTATALGDQDAAQLAKRHLTNYAEAIITISKVIPDVVVSELEKDDHLVNRAAVQQSAQEIQDAWRGGVANS
jgi:ferritin-like metal-binding protein YciE